MELFRSLKVPSIRNGFSIDRINRKLNFSNQNRSFSKKKSDTSQTKSSKASKSTQSQGEEQKILERIQNEADKLSKNFDIKKLGEVQKMIDTERGNWEVQRGGIISKGKDCVFLRINMSSNKSNSIDEKFLNQLDSTLSNVEYNFSDLGKLGIIFISPNRTFSTGFDLPSLLKKNKEQMTSFISLFNKVMFRLLTFPVPTLATINGDAIDEGALFALCCDFRVGFKDAKFGLNQIPMGLVFPSVSFHILENTLLRNPRYYPHIMKGKIMAINEAHELGIFDEVITELKLFENLFFVRHYFNFENQRSIAAFGKVKNEFQKSLILQVQKEGYFSSRDQAFLENWFSKETQEHLHKLAEQSPKQKL